MPKILVEVKPCHIEAGIPGATKYCALGLSITRAIHKTKYTRYEASLENIGKVELIDKYGNCFRLNLPRSARRFEARFEKRLPVKPFKFYLELP
jgi:hypothetical protein